MTNALSILGTLVSPEELREFTAHFESLSLCPDKKEKMLIFDMKQPIQQHGFHPAMWNEIRSFFNHKFQQETKPVLAG